MGYELRDEKLEILKLFMQTNATGVLWGYTFNDSAARFQLPPIHKQLQN